MLRGKHSLNTIWEEHPLNNRPFAKHPISLQPASSGKNYTRVWAILMMIFAVRDFILEAKG